MGFKTLYLKALSLGADEFGYSRLKSKRFYVIYEGKTINFGGRDAETFLEHKDENKRKAWVARHSKILNKHGIKVMGLKTSPSWWALKLLWS
jgi:hypothetical protein